MAKKAVMVKQDDQQPVAREILAEAIVRMSKAAEQLAKSGINQRAIVVLIHDAIPGRGGYGKPAKPTKRDIVDVLDALKDLQRTYCR